MLAARLHAIGFAFNEADASSKLRTNGDLCIFELMALLHDVVQDILVDRVWEPYIRALYHNRAFY